MAMSDAIRLFQMAGGREMVNGAKAKVLLSEITEEDPTMIRLSNKSFDAEAAQLIADRLVKFKNVSVVDISDIIAGRPEDEALKVLEIICNSMANYNIIELNISDNALGSKGVKACLAVLTMKHLQKLWICNNGMAAESAELIASVLLHEEEKDVVVATTIVTSNNNSNSSTTTSSTSTSGSASAQGCPPLTLFHFYNNMAGDGGAKALSRIVEAACLQLQDFRFSATRAGMEGCLSIAKAIGSVTHLKHLDLCDCNFSKQAGVVLCESLAKLTKLETLLLRDSNLGSTGVIVVMDVLSTSATATVASVGETTVASDSTSTTGVVVSSSSSSVTSSSISSRQLHKLDISGNDLSEKGWKTISTVHFKHAAFQSLTELSIDDCELSVENACVFVKSILNHLLHLKVLSLNHCEISSAGALVMATGVVRIISFQELKLDGNAICERIVTQITQLMKTHGKVLAAMEENDDDGEDDVDDYLDDIEAIQTMTLPNLVIIDTTTTTIKETTSVVVVESVTAAASEVSAVDELVAQLDHLGLEKKS